jgi:hypothetical protein
MNLRAVLEDAFLTQYILFTPEEELSLKQKLLSKDHIL